MWRHAERRGDTTVGAVENALTVLEALVSLDGAGVTELAAELSLSKSTIHNHLQTLSKRGYVSRDGTEYRVGLGAVTLGGYVRDHHKLYLVGWSAVNRVAEETGELALVTTEHRGHTLYLYQARGQGAVTTDSYLGIRKQPHCTGTGKAMLSRMAPDRVERLLEEHPLTQRTENSLTDRDTLTRELAEIRETGVAFDDEERILGMRAVASPITDRESGEVVGALSVTGPTSRVKGDWFREEFPEIVKRNAEMVEVDYTYS